MSSPSSENARAVAAERLAVLALTATCFAMSLNANVFAALNPYLKAREGFDDAAIGWLASASGLAGGVAALLLGSLIDRFGRRRPLLWGTGTFGLASVGYLFAGGFAELYAVRIVTGFVAGIVLTSASSAVADLVPYERRGRAMALITAGILLAVPVGMPVAVGLAEAIDWRGIFAVQVACALLTVVGLARALPAELPGEFAHARSSPWRVMREPSVVPALLSVLLYTGAFFATMQFLGTWLDERAILPRGQQWILWISLGGVSAAGGAGLGGAVDRLGKRRWVLWSTLAVGAGLAGLAWVGSPWGLVAVGVPIGVFSASRSAALLALISALVPSEMRGSLMGVRAAAVNLGTGLFPMLAGAITETHGFEAFLRIAAVTMVVAWALVRFRVREVSR